jgi:epoxyqueuosine reductase QueG
MLRRGKEEFKKWITEEIKKFVRKDPENRLYLDGTFIFNEPLVGFVAGDDPIFYQLKEVIGEFHLTPYEVMSKISKLERVSSPSDTNLGVISYVLPISKKTRDENGKMKNMPSKRWVHARLWGEKFNKKLQNHLVSLLKEQGYFAVAPETRRSIYRTLSDDKVGIASTWSQRHIAFAAGLGTFGLCGGLITKAGKAHRTGSVIVNYPLDSPQRTTDINRDCLFFQNEGCQQCIKRCPSGAITNAGHDKERCYTFQFQKLFPIIRKNYGIDIYTCGLCQTAVPCEEKSPVNEEK